MSKTIVLSDEDYKKVPLSGIGGVGLYAIVDKDKFDLLSQFKWWKNDGGYAVTTKYLGGGRLNGKSKKIRMHRLIMGAKEGQIIDHINRNTLDNRIENLRFATYSENGKNSKPHIIQKRKQIIIKKTQLNDFMTALGIIVES